MILLKGGLVVDPGTETEAIRDILIKDDRIIAIENAISEKDIEVDNDEELQVFDCEGYVIGPGLVDAHVHFRDPGFEYKEDIYTGAKAATRGGVTSVILMANTKPAVDNVETLSYVIDKGKETDIDIYTCASITEGLKGEKIVDMKTLLEKGAVGFTDDGIPLLKEEIVAEAMKEAVKNDTVLSFHEENPAYISNNGVNNGMASEYFGIGGSNRQAEIDMVQRDIRLALETGAKVNFQHISTKEAVELIREAKTKTAGKNIHAEATPHHIRFTETDTVRLGTNAKMNPPLRTEEDRQAIIDGLKDGTLDIIATDHAPHSAEEKSKPITEAPSGIIGLETSLSTVYKELVEKNHLSILQVFCKMSRNPAKLYSIDAGELAIDRTANLVIFDPKHEFFYKRTESKSFNSPLKDEKITGDVLMTICHGRIIYKNL